jgi:hypothetical protein
MMDKKYGVCYERSWVAEEVTFDSDQTVMVAFVLNDYIRRVVQDGLDKMADCGCCQQYSLARTALTVLQDKHIPIDGDVQELARKNMYFHDFNFKGPNGPHSEEG